MYEDTVLPIRTKWRVPSQSRAKVHFVQEHTKKSLIFMKWIELGACLLCLTLSFLVIITVGGVSVLDKSVILIVGSLGAVMVVLELVYPYLKGPISTTVQVFYDAGCCLMFGVTSAVIYRTNNPHNLLKVLMAAEAVISVIFLIDFSSKMIISNYLKQIIRINSVVDVSVSAYSPHPPPPPSSSRLLKASRSAFTAIPITHGGTFSVGRNIPPFQPPDENQPGPGIRRDSEIRNIRSPRIHIIGDCRDDMFDFKPISIDRIFTDVKTAQAPAETMDTGTSTGPPFYLQEERRKKSPWTCLTPTTCRRIEPKIKMSRTSAPPITYSGTFAVDKDMVPITPGGFTGSPLSSPRSHKATNIRSEGSSPRRNDLPLPPLGHLDQISEEKMSLQKSSLSSSSFGSRYSDITRP